MRELKFRARFRKISTGEEIWQQAALTRGHITNPLPNLESYIQVSDWEQYTGLKDKNGMDVCEGDRLRVFDMPASPLEQTFEATVVFDKSSFFVIDPRDGEPLFMYFFHTVASNGYKPLVCEILSNVFESPGLLETKEG